MSEITFRPWGRLEDGSEAELFTLTHAEGMQASITTYGATLVQLLVPGPAGRPVDMVLGFDQLEDYLKDSCYLGSVIGRVANRIAQARFRLGAVVYNLDRNQGRHHLHGGSRGFSSRLWKAASVTSAPDPVLTLSYISQDGDQGYPGKLEVAVTYTLTKRSLIMDIRARSDRTTPVNLTGHTYFNLSGTPEHPVFDHEVTIFSQRYLPTTPELIPTGEILPVQDSRFDLTRPTRLSNHAQGSARTEEYDTFFVLDQTSSQRVPAARIRHIPSNRTLEVSTTQPGVHLYTGGGIPHGLRGKNGRIYGPGSGLCLETQAYPDAPNHGAFPSIFLKAKTAYEHSTEYHFPLG